MSRHNVRVKARYPHGFIKNVVNSKVDNQNEKLHMFTKVVMEKQALRERYMKLMNDAEKAVGRKEAIYLFRDAEIIRDKINS
ncbi:hypothetical protein [Prochlorococcus marinus]|uniref:Uncharacterized protein n=1 Tax=Prochlorococcus marinus str. PAC1 TaxID=59924 RepID=A0A0A2C6D6_PROMR|nr:hypothetical protein [Prochlorococcus marinus]KGG20204.1 hypothetical protein EV03_1405 [Prochlorococcus marinus str. PAC1]